MPLYEYECLECQVRREKIQRFSDPPLTTCTSCGGELKRLIHAPAVQFKGTGWYVTDYGGKSTESKNGDQGSSSGSKESSGKDTSTGTKKEPKPAKEKASSSSKSD